MKGRFWYGQSLQVSPRSQALINHLPLSVFCIKTSGLAFLGHPDCRGRVMFAGSINTKYLAQISCLWFIYENVSGECSDSNWFWLTNRTHNFPFLSYLSYIVMHSNIQHNTINIHRNHQPNFKYTHSTSTSWYIATTNKCDNKSTNIYNFTLALPLF